MSVLDKDTTPCLKSVLVGAGAVMKNILFAVIVAGMCLPAVAKAQNTSPTADALSACILRSTSSQDSVTTARWLFIAMSRHPSLPQSARVSDNDGIEANRQMGALVNRLLFDACSTEARASVQAAGQEATLNAAFGTLGEKAMTDLMGNSDVLATVIQLGAYVDRERFDALSAR